MAPDILRSDGEITNSNSCVSSSKVYLQSFFLSSATKSFKNLLSSSSSVI